MVIRAEPGVASALALAIAERIESIAGGPNRCSSTSEEPVKGWMLPTLYEVRVSLLFQKSTCLFLVSEME